MILFNNKEIEFGKFPNGEINIPNSIRQFYRKDRNVITLRYESDEDLFHLLLVRKALNVPCDLAITYFPYSRMDRESTKYVFTLKYVAQFINSLKFDMVTIYEPHSDVTPALLDNVKVINVVPALLSFPTNALRFGNSYQRYQLFFPDAGAQKRYEYLQAEAIVGFKKRDFETGRITHFDVLGKREEDTHSVFILDDLCSKGGTFILAAEKLKEMGFSNIVLVVGHCEETIFEGKIFAPDSLISQVYTSDSIIQSNRGEERLRVIPLWNLQ